MPKRKHFPSVSRNEPGSPAPSSGAHASPSALGCVLLGEPFFVDATEGPLYQRHLKRWLSSESLFQGSRAVAWKSVAGLNDSSLYEQQTDCGVLPLFNFSATSYYARQGLLAPLEELFPNFHQSFLEMGWRRSFVDGYLYSVPLHLSIRLLFFRRDLLKKHGFDPPRTWAELESQALYLRRKERPSVPHGLLFNFNPHIRFSVFLDHIWSQGGDLYESTPRWTLDRKALDTALARVKGFFEQGLTPPEVLESDYGWAFAEFLAGRSVFLHNWSDGIRMIRQLPLQEQERFGWCTLPCLEPGLPGRALIGGPSYVIPRSCRYPQAAAKLMQRLMHPDFQAWYAEKLGWPFPGLKATYFDARVQMARPYIAEAEGLLQHGKLLEECVYLQQHHLDWQAIGNQELTHFLSGTFNRQECIGRMERRFGALLPQPPTTGLAGEAQRRIQLGVERSMNVAGLARDLNVSPEHLSRVFRRATGQGLLESIHAAKMERAKALLKQGKLAVSEVAYRLGFKTPQHFSRVFTQVVKRNPSEFRA